MKYLKHTHLIALALLTISCSNDEPVTPHLESFEYHMNFKIDESEIVYTVRFKYDRVSAQYSIESDNVQAKKFTNYTTGDIILAFYPKLKSDSGKEPPKPINPYEIKKGYVGYSPSTGCWFYGTLYIDNKGNSLFVPASGMDALLNPPLCGYWYA